MSILDIHLEGISPEAFRDRDVTHIFEEILGRDVPIIVSLPPRLEDYWMANCPQVIELVGEIVSREGSALGQQGLNHKCKHQHRFADPWHENACLWYSSPTREEQYKLMSLGREQLERLTKTTPEVYVPPNHLFNQDTLEVAEQMGYRFFSDRAVIRLKPYPFGTMTILPESDSSRADCFYIHYDQIDKNMEIYNQILRKVTSVEQVVVSNVSQTKIKLNSSLKWSWKIFRDFIKAPKRISKRFKN